MNRSNRQGFTLVELLVVVLMLGIMLALLMPALGTAWTVAATTQCRRNLNTVWQAQATWRADRDMSGFATGAGWNGALFPYVEKRGEVFRCPLSVNPQGVSNADLTTQGTDPVTGDPTPPPVQTDPTKPPKDTGVSFSFNVYDSPSFTKFLWNVSVDSQWAKATAMGPNQWHYTIEDRGYLVEQTGDWSWADDYADIDVSVTYEDGRPVSLRIIQGKHGSQGYRFDLMINGELVLHNIDNYSNQVVNLKPTADESQTGTGQGGSGGGAASYAYHYVFLPSDYGISVGMYRVPGIDVPRTDSKLFFIMDFYKSTVDMNRDGDEYKNPDKFFFDDPDEWMRKFGSDSNNWQYYQALRHFGTANVLFCDGHIESLGVDPETPADLVQGTFLRYDSPLWRYSGR